MIFRCSVVALAAAALSCTGMDGEDAVVSTGQAATYDHVPIPERELLITDVSVVENRRLTAFHPDKFNTDAEGAWSFGRLMANLSPTEKPTPRELTRFVVRWLKLWEVDQRVGSYVAPARPAIRDLVLAPWRRDSGCAPDTAPLGTIAANDSCVLDFGRAPFRLLAIVHRPDLRMKPRGHVSLKGMAGQGRYVFGVLSRDALGAERRLAFTIIFEYALPISGWSDVISWGERWHKLGRAGLRWGPAFNDEVHTITREFTKWNIAPGRPNGSALLQIRTNEVSLSSDTPKTWEMREFVLNGAGALVQGGLAREPDASLNGTTTLASWLNANSRAVLNGTHQVPTNMLAARALVLSDFVWTAPGVADPVRAGFALATCSGCHLAETGGVAGTNFLHIRNREQGVAAALSPFLSAELASLRSQDFAALLKAKDANKLDNGPGLDHGRGY